VGFLDEHAHACGMRVHMFVRVWVGGLVNRERFDEWSDVTEEAPIRRHL